MSVTQPIQIPERLFRVVLKCPDFDELFEPCKHDLYDLGSVLSIVPFEHDDGTLWIDRYPVKCYEAPEEEE